jgi:hypothetical protein
MVEHTHWDIWLPTPLMSLKLLIQPSQTCPESFAEYPVHPVLPLRLLVGTVEVLGMPLLTSAMDRQIKETVSKNGKKKCNQLFTNTKGK